MTRKHFIMLADAIRTAEERVITAPNRGIKANTNYAIGCVIEEIANVLQVENPQFDRDRWVKYIDEAR